jgi:hypothetical protein
LIGERDAAMFIICICSRETEKQAPEKMNSPIAAANMMTVVMLTVVRASRMPVVFCDLQICEIGRTHQPEYSAEVLPSGGYHRRSTS